MNKFKNMFLSYCSSHLKNKSRNIVIYISMCLIISSSLTGCGAIKYDASVKMDVATMTDLPVYADCRLSSNYAVVASDEALDDNDYKETGAALLVDDTDKEALLVHNAHTRIYPASMTKIMTGLIVIEMIESGELSLDDTITLDKTVTFTESNVGVSPLVGGCSITIKNLLYGLLVKSFNDCGVILAEHISGSQEAFVELMNQKAKELGATNTHYVNCHGLHSTNHYTTAYDLYLIFSEFITHDLAYMIDSLSTYDFKYTDKDGVVQIQTIEATNGFLTSEFPVPEGYSLGSWKSGTTDAAGSCLIIEFVNDSTGKKYVGIIAKSEDRASLYSQMTELINKANK